MSFALEYHPRKWALRSLAFLSFLANLGSRFATRLFCSCAAAQGKWRRDHGWRPAETTRGLVMRRRVAGTVETREPTAVEIDVYLAESAW